MAYELNSTSLSDLLKSLIGNQDDGLRSAVETLLNLAMKVERENHIKATSYERSEERTDYANGYKPKTLRSRLGELDLQIPQVRSSDFYPSMLEKGQRSERALLLSMTEMYVQGVSTRKVTRILEELCGLNVTSSQVSKISKQLDEGIAAWKARPIGEIAYLYLDAHYEKIRHDNRVVSLAVLKAVGVNTAGKRIVLGISIDLSEAEVHWRQFLEDLLKRGLHGLKLITSDDHAGLKAARRAVIPGVPWQRCQFHLQRNAQAYVAKKELRAEVTSDIRAIFQAPDRFEADRLLKKSVGKYQTSASKLATWMDENIPEGLTVFNFPETHWKRLRTDNVLERLHKEIRRRTKVVGIFPNIASCERLIASILMEVSEGWEIGNNYLTFE